MPRVDKFKMLRSIAKVRPEHRRETRRRGALTEKAVHVPGGLLVVHRRHRPAVSIGLPRAERPSIGPPEAPYLIRLPEQGNPLAINGKRVINISARLVPKAHNRRLPRSRPTHTALKEANPAAQFWRLQSSVPILAPQRMIENDAQ